MAENPEKSFCCLVLLKDLFMLFGNIIFSILSAIFQSIFPKSKKSLKDEIVLITGAGRGLGKELALKFAQLEAIVVLWDINEKSVRDTASQIVKDGGRAHAYLCDVSDWESVQRVGVKVQETIGDVTILVNNAGILQNVAFTDLKIEKIKKTFQVNIMAHFWTNKFFLPRMMENNKGHIVAISSMAGFIGWLYLVDYSATKFAIIGMMEAISEELRVLGKGNVIHCTTACPVTIDTGLNQNPTSRLPWLVPILTPEYTAANIVQAVQRNERIVTIPRRVYFPLIIRRLFPRRVTQLILDFLEYNIVPNEPES